MAATDQPGQRRALVLIDFQHDFLADDGRMPVARTQVESMLASLRPAIDQARQQGDLIVEVGNEFRRRDVVRNVLRRRAAIAGSPGARWDPRFAAPGARYLAKWKTNAFCNPKLEELLREQRVQEVILTGLFAGACVSATAKGAQERGFNISVLVDAVACRSDASRQAALDRLGRQGAGLVRSYPG